MMLRLKTWLQGRKQTGEGAKVMTVQQTDMQQLSSLSTWSQPSVLHLTPRWQLEPRI
jgi:hypothetical protein